MRGALSRGHLNIPMEHSDDQTTREIRIPGKAAYQDFNSRLCPRSHATEECRQRTNNMYVYVDVYIYIYMYICICIRLYIYIYTHACMYACMHTCIHAYMHTCIHAYKHIYIYIYIYIYRERERYTHVC